MVHLASVRSRGGETVSKGFSFAIIEGRLGRDPEVKATPNGTKVATFSLGYDRGFGEKTHTCWMNVVSFKDQAEIVEKYLKQGKPVRVSGELEVRSWDDKDTGKKRYATEVIADKIQFVDGGSGSSSAPATRQERATPPVRTQVAPQPRVAAPADDNPFDDDIPF